MVEDNGRELPIIYTYPITQSDEIDSRYVQV